MDGLIVSDEFSEIAAPPPIVRTGPKRSMTLEWLCEWAYGAQKVDLMTAKTLDVTEAPTHRKRTSTCGCGTMMRHGLLGASINVSRSGMGTWKVHPDAEIVHDAVMEISRDSREAARLIIRHGRVGSVPEWEDTRPRPEMMEADRSRDEHYGRWLYQAEPKKYRDYVMRVAERIYDPATGKTEEAMYCPIGWSPSLEWISIANGAYLFWHEAMTELARMLRPIPFKDHIFAGFDAPQEPWRMAT